MIKRIPVILLVLSNLVPIVGVLAWQWDVAALLILYWSENLIIGAATVLKMFIRAPLLAVVQSLFFVVHYGGFCGMHGLFLLMLVANTPVEFGTDWPFVLVFVEILFDVTRKAYEIAPPEWLFGFVALTISHGASLIVNFVLRGERKQAKSGELMAAPYKRVFVMHIAVILGGMGVMMLGSPLPLLLVLVAGKIVIDVYTHLKEHSQLRGKRDSTAYAASTSA